MDLGGKICELRKKENLSQEQLAEKLNVTRQTISNWELGQTAPDIYQAKEISKIFSISLDELVENNKKDILIEKIDKTEKIASTTMKSMKILKILCIIIIGFLVLFLGVNTYILYEKFDLEQRVNKGKQNYLDTCEKQEILFKIAEEEYQFIIYYNKNFETMSVFWNLAKGYDTALERYNFLTNNVDDFHVCGKDARKVIEGLKQYFTENNGTYEQVM